MAIILITFLVTQGIKLNPDKQKFAESPNQTETPTQESNANLIESDNTELANTNPEPDNTNTAPEQPAPVIALAPQSAVHAKNLSQLIGGFGGGGEIQYDLWKLTETSVLPNTALQTAVPEYELYRLSEADRVTTADKLPGDNDNLISIIGGNTDVSKTTSLPQAVVDQGISTCLDYLISNTITGAPDSCISISEFSEIQYASRNSITSLSQTQTISLVASLTEVNASSLTTQIIESSAWAEDVPIGQISEIRILPPYSNLSGLPVRDDGWLAVFQDDSLIFLQGNLMKPHLPTAGVSSPALISPTQALDRLRDDYQHAGKNQPILYSVFTLNPFGNLQSPSTQNIPDNKVDIDIDYVSLEYWPLTNQEYVGPTQIIDRLVPIYRILGTEKNTQMDFEVFVDAAIEPSLVTRKLLNIR